MENEELKERKNKLNALEALIRSEGWKIVKKWLDERIDTTKETALMNDVPPEDIYKLRAQYAAYKELLDFIYQENIELNKIEIEKLENIK